MKRMMFRIEDFGMYVSLGLFGAGLGLLAGSLIYYKISQNKEQHDEFETQEYPPEEGIEGSEETDASPPAVGGNSGRSELQRKGRQADHLREPQKPGEHRRGSEHSGRAPHELRKEVKEEFERLAQKYQVTKVQKEMVENGIITVKDLEEDLIRRAIEDEELKLGHGEMEDDDPPFEYDQFESPNSSFDVYTINPVDDPDHPAVEANLTKLEYLAWDDQLVRILKNGKRTYVNDPDEYLGEDVMDTALGVLESGYKVVYIWRYDDNKCFAIMMVTDEEATNGR